MTKWHFRTGHPAPVLDQVRRRAAHLKRALGGECRVRKRTLHMLVLMGSWPGTLFARQWLRHKSSKPAFRAAVWLTVLCNLALFVLLSAPHDGNWRNLHIP